MRTLAGASASALRLLGASNTAITGNNFRGMDGTLPTEDDWPNYLIDVTGFSSDLTITGNIFERSKLRAPTSRRRSAT